MSSCPSRCKEAIRERALELGASRCGFAVAAPVGAAADVAYSDWITDGCHASMDYCARYADVRRDPRLLLDSARTVIVCAFCYNPPRLNRLFARYAHGLDYHYVVKDRLRKLGEYITAKFGGDTRALVDTAPMRERYWAVQAGLGFLGVNNQLILPGLGSYFFIGELLWTGAVEPDEPCEASCGSCMRCVEACPGGALDGRGRCDARRCLSYLTIEHRGDLPEGTDLGCHIYGCDECQQVCPHNAHAPVTEISEFMPTDEFLALDRAAIAALTPGGYRRLFRHSAIRRAPLAQLIRNLLALSPE